MNREQAFNAQHRTGKRKSPSFNRKERRERRDKEGKTLRVLCVLLRLSSVVAAQAALGSFVSIRG